MTGSPLSVVVVRFAGGESLGSCLAGLRAQVGAPAGLEVVVVQAAVSTAAGASHAAAASAPTASRARAGEGEGNDLAITVVEGAAGAGPAELRSLGVRASTGTIVAVTEDHCVPAPDWCARVVEAHARPAAAVGGTIALAPWLAGADLAASLLAYGRYMPPRASEPVGALSDCNVSYKRRALERVAPAWEREFVETDVHAALLRDGGVLHLDPAMVVTQGRRVSLAAVAREQRLHGEEYARGRAGRVSALQRRMRALASGLVAPVMALRALQHGRSRGLPLGRLLGAAPAAWRLAAAWGAGERRGYRSSAGA